ncbi:cytochrome d ubiquinol oxidase subunit II [Bombilactobacillus thymidiniphilus]|uniref:Cytochrome d ubiquinol oxidase subunit II n=1 Tax=Bombilactobacillus thymidiniphilus TaxID=2923363 RepID=A0ABY4PB45_9LACO|nr:cytochrome d ubiquinol oxidase subunit II [Bombilactobacillus thymidiniphilus]UQS82978.1 cytochrome d ubiquinol oxidase subunit II [Bombilactobacillus thymidiniphilus]
MTALQFLWFILICVLFSGFFFLEGFDFGVGMAAGIIARNDEEKSTMLEIIGPHWVANETWLVTAGGAMFASFPLWYASLFSGYYIMFLLVLAGLILRGVSFEFVEHAETHRARNLWYIVFVVGSLLAPLMLCIIFFSMIQGIPINAKGDAHLAFFDIINWLSIVGGIAGVLLSLIHGLNYTRLTTTGVLRERARNLNKILYPILFVGEVVVALLVIFQTDFFQKKPISSTIIILLIVLMSLMGAWGTWKDHEGWSLAGSGLSLVSVVILIFNGLFPRVMIANNPANDLLVANSSSSPMALGIMTIVVCVLLPIVLAYFIWSYTLFTKRMASNGKVND